MTFYNLPGVYVEKVGANAPRVKEKQGDFREKGFIWKNICVMPRKLEKTGH